MSTPWTPPPTRAIADPDLDCFHVHMGECCLASHIEEGEARSIQQTMNGIAPLRAAAAAVVHAAHMNPPSDRVLMANISKLASALEHTATLPV